MIEKVIERLNEKTFTAELYDNDKWNGQTVNNLICLGDVKEVLEEIAAEYNNGWIPCSERFPDESGSYLVTYREYSNGEYLPKFDDTYVRKMNFRNDGICNGWRYPVYCDKEAEEDINRTVIAWQPLPQPFEPKEGES